MTDNYSRQSLHLQREILFSLKKDDNIHKCKAQQFKWLYKQRV